MSITKLLSSDISEQQHLQLQIHFRTYYENLKSELRQLYSDFSTLSGEFRANGVFGQSSWQQSATLKRIPEEDLLSIKGHFQEFELLVSKGERPPDAAARYLQKRSFLEKNMEWVQEVLNYLEAQKHIIEIWKKDKQMRSQTEINDIRERLAQLWQMVENKDGIQSWQNFPTPNFQRGSELEARLKQEYNYFMQRIANLVVTNMSSMPRDQVKKIQEIATGSYALSSSNLKSIQFNP